MALPRPKSEEALSHIQSCCQATTAYCGSSFIQGEGMETRDLCVVCADFDVNGACGVCNLKFAGT